ncbi:protein FAM234B isoform X1 [Conger conger]|uniref:protein FAM234B isoform X1 n=1 Tax=Conger conger TaxID=82655 RepID=UPI002A59F09A|nr:protein FAM234B isoform X1 [Conger conger]
MAAALSRALKLPGKKSSELGEYDPLTQADSEDESEEDDLVLNYPRNGLGRGSCLGAGASDLRTGRAGRLVEDDDEVEEDEEEWREQYPSKNRQEREELKTRQYWSQREGSRDVGSDGGGGTGSTGSSGLGSGTDLEEKAARLRGTVRTAFFLVPLCCAVLLVLLCAFLLPCKQSELDKSPQWERELGEAGGGFFPSLALWDVDGDAVEDVLVGVTQQTNESQPAGFQVNSKEYSVVAISAASGKQLWKTVVKEPVKSIQCGHQPQPRPVRGGTRAFLEGSLGPEGGSAAHSQKPLCLVIGSSHLMAVSGTTGKELWSASPGKIVSQAVLILDLDGDEVPDFLIATLPVDQVSSSFGLSLLLLSGVLGNQIGHSVTFNLTARGKLIGPDLHVTGLGAYYILFGLGTVEAASLKDIYIQATGRAPTKIGALKVKDPSWEKLRKNSSLIHISSSCEQVEFLLPLVAGLCNNHNNFDLVSNLNSSRSDWALVCGSSKLSVLRESDTHTEWTADSTDVHGRPAPGQFNEDGVPDLLVQQSVAPGVRKVQVIDGANGRGLWEAEFVCPQLDLEGSSMATSTGISVFLFWAGELQTLKNLTKAPVSQGVAPTVDPASPVLRRLYLLHPAYPTILMELTTTTDTLLSAAVSYQEQQKDASYITVSARPAKPGVQVLRSQSLRASIAGANIVRLGEDKQSGASVRPGAFEINKFFRNLSFRQQ